MDIILVSNRFAKARSLRLRGRHLFLIALLLLGAFWTAVFAAQYAMVRLAPDRLSPEMRTWIASMQPNPQKSSYWQDGLDAIAVRVGQMQAQMVRLDSLGARLAKMSGVETQEFNFDQPPAMGGPYEPAGERDVSLEELDKQLSNLSAQVSDRNDKLLALQAVLLQSNIDKKMFPSEVPLANAEYSSYFGWRIDPFTGKNALHQGVDLTAPEGTPIMAAAGGIVVFAGNHPRYGNMVEIDHGNDFVTRYGHASKLLVKEGQIVRRGQEIARVGSTGRSTGSHLHFEVRYKGIAQDPRQFLKNAAG